MLKYPVSGCQTTFNQVALAKVGVSRCCGHFPSRVGLNVKPSILNLQSL